MRDPVDVPFLRLLPVNPCHLVEIAAGAFLKMTDAQRDLPGCEVAITVVHRFELAAVKGHASATQNANAATEFNEARASLTDSWGIDLPEVSNRFVIWCQTTSQPHDLNIPASLALQTAT